MELVLFVILGLLAVNLLTVLTFWRDKRRAIGGYRRIAELDLLCLAAIGGTPGAFLARHMFRHKTRKQPFSTRLYVIAVIQVGLLVGFLAPMP